MNKKIINFYILLFVTALIGFYSCQPKADVLVTNKIDTQLQPFYEAFLNEGTSFGRNIKIPSSGISLQFGKLEKYQGFTYYDTNKVIIDSTAWKNLTGEAREWLIFHELGHLLLGLSHNWSLLPDGEWYSAMWTTEDAPNTNSITFSGIRRKYYVEQLFYPSVPTPEWASVSYNPFPISKSNRKLIFEQEFDKSINLQEYINQLSNVQANILSTSLLNVKLPKGFGFNFSDQKAMELEGASNEQINAFKQSTNYEVEIRYRINKEAKIGIGYGFTSARSKLGIFHNLDLSAEIISRDIWFKSPNLNFFNPNGQFNIIRIIRQGNFFSIYINDKHFFYSDIFDKQDSNLFECSIYGNGLNADFDLDYYRIYQRL